MNDRLINAGLAVCAILILIPMVMIGRLIFGVVAGYREHRRAARRKVTVSVDGLGDFSSTNDRLWFGEVRGVQISLSGLGAPSDVEVKQVAKLLNRLPLLTRQAQQFLMEHEDASWLADTVGHFEPFGIELVSDGAFVLELTHPADSDGVYRVEFRGGLPVSSNRDD